MNSRTIELDYGSFLVTVEATQDGKVLEAKLTSDLMEEVDVTANFRGSDFAMKELWKRIMEIDWNDHGDDDFSMEPLEMIKAGLRPA